jgi:hypothetical protein
LHVKLFGFGVEGVQVKPVGKLVGFDPVGVKLYPSLSPYAAAYVAGVYPVPP